MRCWLGPLSAAAASLALLVSCNTVEKTTTKMMDQAQCRALQTEAQAALKALVAAQDDHKDARDTYSKTIGGLGVDVEEATVHYTIKLIEVDKDTFIAEAHADDADLNGDTWRIDGKGKLENTKDGCK